MVVILTPIVLMVVGIPGNIYHDFFPPRETNGMNNQQLENDPLF